MYGAQKAKGLFSKMKYQNFRHRSQNEMYCSKLIKCYELWRSQMKRLQIYVIILWEVIYVHFYNWDKSLDLILVVYDLIELIIKALLWTMEYFTFDTHTQHTRLLFNECLFHLCDCTWSNVMCILKCLLIKSKKIFEYFICFWKCFYTFVFLVFV